MVKIRQLDQILHRDGPGTLFVPPVHLPLDVEQIGNLLLRQVVIDPQIFDALKKYIASPLDTCYHFVVF